MEDYRITLWCLLDEKPFRIDPVLSADVDQLKVLIKMKIAPALDHVPIHTLTLLKVAVSVPLRPAKDLAERVHSLGPHILCELEDPVDKVSKHFGDIVEDDLHIIVCPPTGEPAQKRARPSNDKTSTPLFNVSPTLNGDAILVDMTTAMKPFIPYINYLADGTLDGYINSHCRSQKFLVPEVKMSNDPNLLLHELGVSVDHKRIKQLFDNHTAHIYNTSGSGKTRHLLDGLCHHWGFYLSCRREDVAGGGSADFSTAVESMLPTLGLWEGDSIQKSQAAMHIFSMILCGRVFILQQLVNCLPENTSSLQARRRWVLLQAMPPVIALQDIFVCLLDILRACDYHFMQEYIRSTLAGLVKDHQHLFPDECFFTVLDEAQAVSKMHMQCFPSTTEPEYMKHSILHEAYGYFSSSPVMHGIIISGTGLSVKIVKEEFRSSFAKERAGIYINKMFTDTGNFMDPESHKMYILHHLNLSDNPSDQYLLRRMQLWLRGRHRPTASLIGLLLHSENLPRHRILSAYVKHMTKFTVTDAIDLEEQEDPIPDEITKKIQRLSPPTSIECILGDTTNNELVQILVNALIRWVVGSELSPIPIKNNTRKLVDLGVGHLEGPQEGTFDASLEYPVYIGEPLVILYLSSLFERKDWTEWKALHHDSLYQRLVSSTDALVAPQLKDGE